MYNRHKTHVTWFQKIKFQVVGHSMIYVHKNQGHYVANHVRYK